MIARLLTHLGAFASPTLLPATDDDEETAMVVFGRNPVGVMGTKPGSLVLDRGDRDSGPARMTESARCGRRGPVSIRATRSIGHDVPIRPRRRGR